MPRISEHAKVATRDRIVDSACKSFKKNGFEKTTTRHIACQAGIASGTLFNYFPTKEAIVTTLVAEGLERAADDLSRQKREGGSLEEDLFLHVSAGLRQLKRHRTYLEPVIETALSPLARSADDLTESIRVDHLETVQEIVRQHGLAEPSAVAMQLYWTLYTGVLAYWVKDSSPNQEDSLAMLDQSVQMFVDWLRNVTANSP